MFDPKQKFQQVGDRAGKRAERRGRYGRRGAWAGVAPVAWFLVLFAVGPAAAAQTQIPSAQANPVPLRTPEPNQGLEPERIPPRVLEAQRFLRERGWTPGRRM